MEALQDTAFDLWNFYINAFNNADTRVANWPLMSAYWPTWALTALYLFAVWAGMRIMKSREAFHFRWTLFVYNAALVALNFHICFELFTATWRRNYSYSCQPVNYSNDPDEMRIASAIWWYYFSKCVEFLDTIFFILRKKNGQVSFLHVYHHATMFPIWWIGVKWVAGGQSFFGAMINSFIHVLMYSYYGVSALGPQFQKYLWWKRYLTRLQLAQFFVGMAKVFHSLYIDCDFPKWMHWSGAVYGVTIIILFGNYYYQEYYHRPQLRKGQKQVQFIAGMAHAAQSLVVHCSYPIWMQWALIIYGASIFGLFLNFYYHAYVKSAKIKKSKSQNEANGHVANGVNGHAKKDE